MTIRSVEITVGQSLGDGRYSPSLKGTSKSDTTTILTDITAALTACTTALGHAGGSFDSTTDITAIQTAVTTVQTDATALTGAIAGDVMVTWDSTKVTNRNQLRAALNHAIKAAVESGYGGLSE